MTKLSMKTIRFDMITGVCIGMIWMIFSHDRIGVMYFGKLVEMADADELFRWGLSFCVRDPEAAEPSDWELASRYFTWIALPMIALAMFIMGLQ